MAAVPSLSEKPVTTTTKELQSNRDSHPVVSPHVETLVKEVLAWQRRIHNRRIPNRYSRDVKERKLGSRFAKVLLRRDKAVGKEPSRSQLSQSETSLVNSVPGVPPHGCSVIASCSNSSMGEHVLESSSADVHHPAVFSSSRRGSPLGRKRSSVDSRHVQTLVHVQRLVKEVLAWQRRILNRGRIPNKYSHDAEESKLGDRFAKLLLRRDKALARGSQLSHSEAALVNSVRGVPLHGCSAKSACNNRFDQLETGRSKVRKKSATGCGSSSPGSRCGRKKAKNKGSTAEAIKKQAASDACTQAKRQALTVFPAKAGAMASTRKPSVQARGTSTGGGSGNGSRGVHSTAVAADAKMMLLPTPIRQQPPHPTWTPSGTPQSPPFPKSWNTQLEGSHCERSSRG